MNPSLLPYKGTRDFYPEDKRLQNYMFGMLRRSVQLYGYQEYDAPILEPLDLYLMKSSKEIVEDQTYNFIDRGGRQVTLRPEMTPSVSRMVAARRQELSYPLRLFSLPNLWRYERPQHGRLREHWQLNVDLFGVEGIEADHEVIQLADTILKRFGAKASMYQIKVNSRSLVNSMLRDHFKLEATQVDALIRLIDRMHKIEPEKFFTEVDMLLSPSQREDGLGGKIGQLLAVRSLDSLPEEIKSHASVSKLQQLLTMLEQSKVTSAIFDITLMRGFDYYTDIVFEVFDLSPDNNRSMFGGGRYDGLVGQFGVEPVPTVGFGLGDVTLRLFLEGHGLLPSLPPETDAVVLLIGDVYLRAQKPVELLRSEGVRVAVDSTGRKLDKQIKSAVKAGVRYSIIMGEEELSSQQYVLRDLVAGSEEKHSLERIISIVAKNHQRDDDL